MKTVNKPNSQSRVEIMTINRGDLIMASHVQGEGFNQVFFQAKYFKTMAGAERWATKVVIA